MSHKSTGWISVKERLPEVGERTLIKPRYGEFVTEAYFGMSHVWVGNGGIWYEDVTHWMPLPQPPKEE